MNILIFYKLFKKTKNKFKPTFKFFYFYLKMITTDYLKMMLLVFNYCIFKNYSSELYLF